MDKFKFPSFLKVIDYKKAMIFFLTFVLIYGILLSSLGTKKYNLKEGDIAKVNITAPREVKDELSTAARIKQEVDSVPLQYDNLPEVKTEALAHVDALFLNAISLKDQTMDDPKKIAKLKSESPVNLSDDDIKEILSLSKDELKSLQNLLDSALTEVYDKNIADKSDEISKAQQAADLKISVSSFSKSVKDTATNIANINIKSNYSYDDKKTQQLKSDTMKNVPPVMIKKGQIIIKEGEPVTKYQLEILKELSMLNNNKGFLWYIYISLGFMVLGVLIIMWAYIYKYYNDLFNNNNKLVLINLLNCIALLLARTLSIINPFLIPLACVPMLMTLLLNNKISLTISVLNCIFISTVSGFNIEITILAIISAVLGSSALQKMQQRNDIVYSATYLAVISAVISSSIGFLVSNNAIEIFKKCGFSFLGALLSGVLTVGLLPALESMFDIVTTMKLLELSNPNNPLLKKLLLEAPGTYHHSIMVANLAEVAAEKVGANPVLARVAAYYHDVGKIKRPYFFKENQMGVSNPHDKITPNLSTLIITSHVKDGLELAKDYKIPKIIQEIIEEHHGDSLVKYFYLVTKNSSESPEEVKEEDFRYLGPIPTTKESGIIMLADGVEAAVRSINEPTKGKVSEMVNNIIKDRLGDGQLNHCDLTLKDVDIIRESFVKILLSVYHERIEYPVDKWEEKNKEAEKRNDIQR